MNNNFILICVLFNATFLTLFIVTVVQKCYFASVNDLVFQDAKQRPPTEGCRNATQLYGKKKQLLEVVESTFNIKFKWF